MQYIVTTQSNRRYEISNDRQQPLGVMDTYVWQPAKARITTVNGNIYEITATGFWQTKKLITKNSMPYATLTTKLGTGFELSFENGRTFLFHKKSFWSSSEFIISNETGNDIAVVRSWFSWKILGFRYDIQVNEHLLDQETNFSLPFILIYCIRLFRMRAS